jgi:hypothetical protein
MKKFVIVGLTIVVLFAIFGLYYFLPAQTEVGQAKEYCIKACEDALASGQNLTNGPCLLNPISELPDWVCDVTHSLRQSIDNLPENQCQAFREGRAHHFIEVDSSCNFIKAV